MGALLDGDEHNVGDTHHAAQQCEKADDPKGVAEDTDGGILLLGALGCVVDPKSILVGGREAVAAGYGAADVSRELCRSGVGGDTGGAEVELIDVDAGVVGCTQGGEGDVTSSLSPVTLVTAYTDDAVGEGIDPHHFVDGSFGRPKEVFCHFIGDDHHFAALLHVEVVDEATGEHLDVSHLDRERIDAFKPTAHLVLTADDAHRLLERNLGSGFGDVAG